MSLLSHFNSSRVGEQPSEPATDADPNGLSSWSSHVGSSEHAAAIQMAAMLAGVAGPIVELDHGEVPRPMSPLVPVLVTKGGRRPRSLEALRSLPLDMDVRLRKRFAGFSAEDFHCAARRLRGAQSQFVEDTEASYHAKVEALLKESGEMGGPDPYHSDWEPDVYERRLSTVLRPGFILENPAIPKLPSLVAGCHDSTALLPGFPLANLLRGGAVAFGEFFELVDGRDVDLPPRVTGSSLTKSERGEIRCILTAAPAEIADAMQAFPGFANRVILVDASRPAAPGAWDEGKVALFHHLYNRMLQSAADKRRRGHCLEFHPWSPAGRRLRLDNQAAYLNACDAAGVSCAGLEDLPAILRCAFDLFQWRASPADEEVAGLIHRICLALLDDHVRLLGAAEHRAKVTCQLDLAEKLVVRISSKQPVRQRDLVRTFDNQKVELYRPVLDLLVKERVLVEEPRNVFRLGACNLEAVRLRWLADPVLLS